MNSVLDFVQWGLTHVKSATVPVGAILPVSFSTVGCAGEWEYLFGTTGHPITKALLDRKFKDYYSKNGWTRAEYDAETKGWIGRTACDCQGVEDYFSRADRNANHNYTSYCTDKGLCSAIDRPYVIGEAVFNGSSLKKTHVGWVCGFMPDGDVLVMEERGICYGFVITRMSNRPWKYRGLMTKRYDYDVTTEQPTVEFVFTRLLKYGCKGDDVKNLKIALAADGYGSLDVGNGNFYGDTRNVVKQFQRDNGLTVDGIAGSRTYGALGIKFKL